MCLSEILLRIISNVVVVANCLEIGSSFWDRSVLYESPPPEVFVLLKFFLHKNLPCSKILVETLIVVGLYN